MLSFRDHSRLGYGRYTLSRLVSRESSGGKASGTDILCYELVPRTTSETSFRQGKFWQKGNPHCTTIEDELPWHVWGWWRGWSKYSWDERSRGSYGQSRGCNTVVKIKLLSADTLATADARSDGKLPVQDGVVWRYGVCSRRSFRAVYVERKSYTARHPAQASC